jgi:uncharacterized repeat protein (TIGR01451 family)
MRLSPTRPLVAAFAAAGVIASLCAPAVAAGASAPSPAWQVLQASHPTVLVPGTEAEGTTVSVPEYELFITNVGGKAAAGAVVTDVLPEGVTPAAAGSASGPFYEYIPSRNKSESGSCPVSGETITCTVSQTVAAGASFAIRIPLVVSSALASPSVVLNEVTVASGGSASSRLLETAVAADPAPFGILPGSGLTTAVFDEGGETPSAGSHPFVASFNVGVSGLETPDSSWAPVQAMRRVSLGLPQGLVVDPMATQERCSQQVLSHGATTEPVVTCPAGSQVGMAYPVSAGLLQHVPNPVYNVVPPPGAAAALAFELEGTVVEILGGLSGGFHLTARSTELITRFKVGEIAITLWGVPSDGRHDQERIGGELGSPGECLKAGCSVEPSSAPFVTMPTSCTEPTIVSATVESWLGAVASATRPMTDRDGGAVAINRCGGLSFDPAITSRPTTSAGESASGLDFNLHQPQDESLEGRSTATLKDANVTLPEGMTLNPSAANGLGSCTEEQMGYEPELEPGKVRFSTAPQSCPDSAKVGTLEVATPLLGKKLPGSVYVAKPFDNPFGSLLAIYLAVEDVETGIVAKLAGKVEPDPTTGRLTARFTDNPELPIEDIDLHFFSGDRGALMTPLNCGTSTTTSTLTPWSTPEGAEAHPSDSFDISSSCSSSEATAPKTANFTAGTVTPLSGAYSPFVLRISRPDGSQHFTGIETTLPQGLLGKLAGVSYCPESAIAKAKGREAPERGKAERGEPSCPPPSDVGTVQVAAGAGNAPIRVSGHAYLAGPYKGAPLSLVVIVPAVAGPFDLGTVVDRVALNVGEYDARIHAVADPLPTILDGIPLDVRSIEVKLDRSEFTLNPTSCEAMAIEGSVSTQAGQTAPLNNRFQVGECGRLAFKPKLSISLKGATKRTGHPALKAVVTYPKQGEYANIARAQVSLPHSEFLDQGSIGKACTKPVLAAHACPVKSIYGKVKAWTPLLEKPLEGPVYLVGGYGYKLPAMVAELNGQIRVLLVGKVDTDKQHGIRNTFEAVPDAPVEKFTLELKGGKKYGLLENSENICRKKQNAGVAFRAQNGRVKKLSVTIANSCGKAKKKGKGAGHKKGKKSSGKKSQKSVRKAN